MKPLIIFCGLSGTGKSYTSKIVQQKLPEYTILNIGDFRERLGITTYSRKDTPKLLSMAIEEIEKNHHNQIGSILDANLKSVDLRQCFYDLGKHLNTTIILVELTCSDETAKRRMTDRTQTTLAENPKEHFIYDAQKRVWQDIKMDLHGNNHVSFIRFNTETKEVTFLSDHEPTEFVNKVIQSLN